MQSLVLPAMTKSLIIIGMIQSLVVLTAVTYKLVLPSHIGMRQLFVVLSEQLNTVPHNHRNETVFRTQNSDTLSHTHINIDI